MQTATKLSQSDDVRQAWEACKVQKEFCPVSFKRYSPIFWFLFTLTSAISISLNLIFTNPMLHSLFMMPLLFISMVHIPRVTVMLSVGGLIATWLWLFPMEASMSIPMLTYAAVVILVKRVIIVSRRNFQQKEENESLIMNTVFSFAKSIDARDPYTAFHSRNVAAYAKQIAVELGLTKQEIQAIYLAGLIHDIGKIGTPERILNKEGRLTEEEFELMKKHPEEGYQIIKDMKQLKDLGITDMVRYHHERMDGKGYPSGLAGSQIPLGARILAVSDAYDAMTTNRSYRPKLSSNIAADEIRRHQGTQFDPQTANALLKVLVKEGKLEETLEGGFLSVAAKTS